MSRVKRQVEEGSDPGRGILGQDIGIGILGPPCSLQQLAVNELVTDTICPKPSKLC